jgi:hypothetical protein
MNQYFFINKKSISKELCKKIIDFYHEDDGKYQGVTAGGLNKNVKDTRDLNIPTNSENPNYEKWRNIHTFLEKELNKNVKEYVKNLDNNINSNHEKENTDENYFNFGNFLSNESFMIQHYTKNKGRYIYHNDFTCDYVNKKFRVITFLWYLNDVEEGGETEFWTSHKIKPEAGKLLLFPACWTFPHRGTIPLSSDKYIITGWLYSNK